MRCVELDTSHPDFFDMETFVAKEEKDNTDGRGEDNVPDKLEEV